LKTNVDQTLSRHIEAVAEPLLPVVASCPGPFKGPLAVWQQRDKRPCRKMRC
jgi:hypothetical protein